MLSRVIILLSHLCWNKIWVVKEWQYYCHAFVDTRYGLSRVTILLSHLCWNKIWVIVSVQEILKIYIIEQKIYPNHQDEWYIDHSDLSWYVSDDWLYCTIVTPLLKQDTNVWVVNCKGDNTIVTPRLNQNRGRHSGCLLVEGKFKEVIVSGHVTINDPIENIHI